jgi:hypothetical protein
MAEKRRLGRGLDDLMAQHDQDLPFLDAYGPTIGEEEESPSTSDQLREVIERLLRSIGDDGSNIQIQPLDEGVTITLSGKNLPLVPSDLAQIGLEAGTLNTKRSKAVVTIVRWGIPARRLIERMCEHWASQ